MKKIKAVIKIIKKMDCKICPNNCELEVAFEPEEILSVTGNNCPKGRDYAIQELLNPMRIVIASVRVLGGAGDACSVRTDKKVSRDKVFSVLKAIKRSKIKAPVSMGQVVIEDVLGLGIDIIATKNIDKT